MLELNNLDWQKILDRLADFATSAQAKSYLLELKSFENQQEAEQNFQHIEGAYKIVGTGNRPRMESLDLFPLWHGRIIKNGSLKPIEFKDVRHFCLECITLKEVFSPSQNQFIADLGSALFNAEEPLSAIEQIITDEGGIRTDASESIYKLTQEREQKTRQIQNLLEKIVRDHKLESVIQEKFVTTREGRWVLPIRSGMQSHFGGIIHANSRSKQTVFMEPETLIPLNNRMREIDVEIEDEIERLLRQLSEYLHSIKDKFLHAKEVLLKADISFAQAQLALALSATPPKFSEKHIILKELKHPLLVLNKENTISNDVELGKDKQILLLSGPNAGGKTVLLKSIGLAAQMARAGLWIVAEAESEIPFFSKILIAIGDEQSVDKHLSTFAAHLKSLNSAAQLKGHESLILIDEICGSTDPEEGSALARSFIEKFADNDVLAVITSHLGALKGNWEENSGVVHGSMEFDKKSGPTYSLMMGIPGQSLAMLTAKNVGVDSDILEKAKEYLSPERQKYQKGLEDLDQLKNSLRKMEADLKAEKKSTLKTKQKYDSELAKLTKEKENILSKAARSAEKKVDDMIQKASAKDIFKKHSEAHKLKADLPEIIKAGKSSPNIIENAQDFADRFPPGSKVYVNSFGQDGVVQSKPNSKGEVNVVSRSMRLSVPWQDLRAPNQPQNPMTKVLNQRGRSGISAKDQDRVVDVRGLSVDEALEQLDIQLDTAALREEDRVKIIHGHGTSTLKRAIRSYLSRSIYVKKWQAGTKESGGDGLTWAEIKD